MSPFTRRSKTIATLVAVVAAISVVMYEAYQNKPRAGLINPTQLQICGVSVRQSYRSDYKVDLCLENGSDHIVRRVKFLLTSEQCSASGSCQTVEAVARDLPVTIAAKQTTQLNETLRFDVLAEIDSNVDETTEPDLEIVWSAEVLEVLATP